MVKHIHVVLEWDVSTCKWTQFIQTFVLQEAVEAGCNGDAWPKTFNTPFVLTVTFVEFLVLTSVVWEPWEEKQELQLVDVPDKQVTVVKHMVLEFMGGTGVNPAWCSRGCSFHSRVVDNPGQSTFRGNWASCCAGGSDKVEPRNSKDNICIRKKDGNIRKLQNINSRQLFR